MEKIVLKWAIKNKWLNVQERYLNNQEIFDMCFDSIIQKMYDGCGMSDRRKIGYDIKDSEVFTFCKKKEVAYTDL